MKLNFIILSFSLIAVLVLASVGYNKLSKSYDTINEKPTQAYSSETQTKEKAIDFVVLNNEGKEVNLSDYFGKPIVLNFWASWCGPCKIEMPTFDKVYLKYKDKINFLMVNLTDGSRDTVTGVKEFITNAGYSFPVFFDTNYSAAENYGIYSIPTTIFIDKDGYIMDYHIGIMSEELLINYIQNI